MNKVVFLDRDGTLNSNLQHYYIHKVKDIVINEGVIRGLKILIDAGFILVIITNQGGISKGEYTIEDMTLVNDFMIKKFKKERIDIEGIYYCSHHPIHENCLCRKPKSLLLEKAVYLHQAILEKSFFIGDSESDMLCATHVGIKGIKIDRDENIVKYCKEIVREAGI